MPDMEETLQALLGSEENMKKMAQLAASVFSGSVAERSKTAQNKQTEDSPKNDLSQSAPVDLSRLLSGMKQKAEHSDRLNLLMALKPFLKEGRQTDIERAAKMVQTARAARGALEGMKSMK